MRVLDEGMRKGSRREMNSDRNRLRKAWRMKNDDTQNKSRKSNLSFEFLGRAIEFLTPAENT